MDGGEDAAEGCDILIRQTGFPVDVREQSGRFCANPFNDLAPIVGYRDNDGTAVGRILTPI